MGEVQNRGERLTGVDALRGLAAMAVVLFHYTAKFGELYPQAPHLGWGLWHGHYGVNLFFIISGFVIFMTLERSRTGMDFVVSRFSRLYPAYWLAIGLTFAITHWLGLPGKLASGSQALANLTMVHGFAGIPHVDGVYWTLEVELLFYLGMFVLFKLRRLDNVFAAVGALLLLRMAYLLLRSQFGVDLPYIAWRLLILEHLPWFALGLSIYATLGAADRPDRRSRAIGLALAALAALALDPVTVKAPLALALALVVYLAAAGRLRFLQWPVLVWLGSISYPLYLLHENIGWSVLLHLGQAGWSAEASTAVVVLGMLALSHGVSRMVEQPAMHWVRSRWKARTRSAA